MSIAEKLITVAENVPKVYKAGQKSMVDESKIIEKTVSGSVIALDDVSEVPHEVGVQLSSDTVTDFSGVAVKVFGENFWKFGSSFSVEGNGTLQVLVDTYDFVLPLGVYTFSCDTEIENLNMSSNGNGVYLGIIQEDGTTTYHTIVGNDSVSGKVTFTVDISSSAINRLIMSLHNRVTSGTIKITNIYLTASEHESYVPKADGSVNVKSMSPYMTISTDTNGINITATYHKSWGMQTEYDRFWDAYQNNGNRTSYSYAFAGTGWNDANLNPKHPIVCSGGLSYMFRDSSATYGDKIFEIDISQVSSGSGIFYNSRIKRIGVLDTRSLSDLNTMFQYNSNLTSIEKIILKDDGSQKFTATFSSCPKIEEIRFEGVIGKSLDIHWSTKLSMLSLASIVGALSKTVSGQSITLPTTARDTYDSATISGSWDNLVAQYPNWSFKYS